jgi:hypothetical protein
MIKRLSILLLLVCSTANAQFVTGQILTAQQLNNAFANVLALTGGTLSGPLAAPAMTVTGNLTVNGTFTLNGGLLPSSLAPQAANTVLANATGSTASPTAFAMPSCGASNNALRWNSGTGFFCITSMAATTGTLAQFAATTSAQLAGVISDETGSGSLVFGTNPTVSGATISGGTISNTPISGSTGSFTTLAASGTVSGAGFTSLLSPYAPLASPTFTGTVTIPGGASISGYLTSATAASTYAPLASPALTGTPTAPTASAGTNTTQLATTAYVQAATGRLINVQVFTSGGTYTPTSGATSAIIEGIGAGGGGGGVAATSSSQVAIGGGGSSGSFGKIRVTSLSSQTVTIGALGSGGSAGANAGSSGGQTSVGTWLVCPGGLGGSAGAAQTLTNAQIFAGSTGSGAICTTTATPIFLSKGNASPFGISAYNTGGANSGAGANSPYGAGGQASSGAAFNASGYGAGGSGASNNISSSAQAGGNGTSGLVIIYEFN